MRAPLLPEWKKHAADLESEMLKRGMLFEVDPRPYEAQYDQARAAVIKSLETDPAYTAAKAESDSTLAELKRAAEISDAAAAREDYALARAAGLHFRSVANQTRFVLARDAGRRDEATRVARDEATVAKELWKLARQDSRIGFEASNHYYYVPQDLVEKVLNCQDVIDAP